MDATLGSPPSAEDLALALELTAAADRQDPLARFSIECNGRRHEAQYRFVEAVLAGLETFLRAGNQAGKTWIGAALLIALARGKREFLGFTLPAIPGRTIWWVLTQTYQQQVHSTQAAILKLLGDWPHRVYYSRHYPTAASVILVQPEDRQEIDQRAWNEITFIVRATGQKNKNSLPGARINGAWADEPCDMDMWEEVQARGQEGYTLFTWLTVTPIDPDGWIPLRERFGDHEGRAEGGRIEIRCTVYDNPFLSAAHIRDLEQRWRGDRHEQARLRGDYIDDTGSCPFSREHLDRWRKRIRRPQLIEVQIFTEIKDAQAQRYRVPIIVQYEAYEPVDPLEEYYANLDPSLGIRPRHAQDKHDPAEIHVYARRRPRLVARWNGYMAPYAQGWLLGILAMRYPGYADCEANDNLIETVLRGAAEAGHTNFFPETHVDKTTGQVSHTLGWKTTTVSRGLYISGCQTAMAEDSVLIEAGGVIDQLAGCVVKHDRIEAKYGRHDEAMILLGRFVHVSSVLGVPPPPPPEQTGFRAVLKQYGIEVAAPDYSEEEEAA